MMKELEFRNLISFLVLMETGEGIKDKAPSFVLEKFKDYVKSEQVDFRWGLDKPSQIKYHNYFRKWNKGFPWVRKKKIK